MSGTCTLAPAVPAACSYILVNTDWLCAVHFSLCSLQFIYIAVAHLLIFGSLQNSLLQLPDQPVPVSCQQHPPYLPLPPEPSRSGIPWSRIISCIDSFLTLLILCLELSSFLDCLLDIGIGHIGSSGNGDVLLLAGTQILCGYIYDTVGIDIEGNLNLRNTSSCRRDTIQTELAEGLVVSCELTLTLYYVDIYGGLVISCGGEDLALLGRDGCISLDQSGSNTAHGLDGQGQRSYIQKKDITGTGIACKLTTLDRSTDGYALIRVQRLAGLFAGQLFYFLLCCRHTCGTADQQYLCQAQQRSCLHLLMRSVPEFGSSLR